MPSIKFKWASGPGWVFGIGFDSYGFVASFGKPAVEVRIR